MATWKTQRRLHDNIKMNLREMGWGTWTGSDWLRSGTCGGSCDCSDEHSLSTVVSNFLTV